jgi:hypothetical protein
MPSLDRQVAASADDCGRHKNSDFFFAGYINFPAGYYSVGYQGCGAAARFTNITIPKGATITAAYFTPTASNNVPGANMVVNTRLRAQATDNAAQFSDQTDFDARTWTTACVNWDALPAWTTGVEYNSPELKTLIQEVVNRSGWVSGNALVILWEDWEERSTQSNEVWRNAYSYDFSPSKAPKLHIEWEVPPAGFVPLPTAVDGYRCFIQQYVKNLILGAPPWKLPDGTKW